MAMLFYCSWDVSKFPSFSFHDKICTVRLAWSAMCVIIYVCNSRVLVFFVYKTMTKFSFSH